MTATELLSTAKNQADQSSSPQVRKAALLWTARAQSVLTPQSVEATLNQALSINTGPSDDFRNHGFEQQTRYIIAAVAPHKLKDLPPLSRQSGHGVHGLAQVMLSHGQSQYLRTYLLQEASLSEYLIGDISTAIRHASSTDERAVFLRRAAEVWRAQRIDPQFHHLFANHRHFFNLFRRQWRNLPRPEAAALLDEILDHILQAPDVSTTSRLLDVEFSSAHAATLFEVYNALLELDPHRAQSLAKGNPDLARALNRYPAGWETIEEELAAARAKAKARPRDPNAKPGFVGFTTSHHNLDRARNIMEAQRDGDFSQALQHLADAYSEDADPVNPNLAPKPFWPSTGQYRSLFHSMGKRLAESAQEKLPVISDADLRLFAQIELAAGMCGLPELPSMGQTARERE